LFHFNTEELTRGERCEILEDMGLRKSNKLAWTTQDEKECDKNNIPKRRLNLLLYQRSCDTFLGVPFNITSYSLLLAMVAHCVNMEPGVFTHTYGDLHIYKNHIEQVNEQLSRSPKVLPELWLNPEKKDLFKFTFDDIKLVEGTYNPHPTIKAPIAV
jgi:thymidylate synthase